LDFPSLLPGHGQANKAVPSKTVAAPAPSVFRQAAAPAAVARASPADFPSLGATAVSAKTAATKAKKQPSSKGTLNTLGFRASMKSFVPPSL
jgi:hypothetical protein